MKPLALTIAQSLCRFPPPIIAQRLRDLIYPREQAYRDNYEFSVRSQTGSWFKGRTNDYHAYPFSVHGYSYWQNWAIAKAICSSGNEVVEIGANVGTETVGFSDIVGAGGKVHAFEPLPANLDFLRQTLPLCRHNNVTVYPMAVGEKEQLVHFSVPKSSHGSGSGHVVNLSDAQQMITIEIKCVSLDSLIDSFRSVRVLFIDVEGSEANVLRGASNLIVRDRPILVLEAAPKLLARTGSTVSSLHKEVQELGYNIYRRTRLGFEVAKPNSFDAKGDWLCLPSSKCELYKTVERYFNKCAFLPCIPGLNPLTQF